MFVSEISDRVKNIFGDTSGVQITDPMILDWVNDGQIDICRKAECLEGIQSINLVAGTDSYAYAVDFIKEQRIAVNGIKARRMTLPALDILFPDRSATITSGNPLYYYHHNRKFNLYPSPGATAAAGMLVWYIRNAVQLTASNQTPEIPVIFHEDLVRYCLWRALEQDEQWVPSRDMHTDYDNRLMNTIYDSNVKQSEAYPSVQLCPGD